MKSTVKGLAYKKCPVTDSYDEEEGGGEGREKRGRGGRRRRGSREKGEDAGIQSWVQHSQGIQEVLNHHPAFTFQLEPEVCLS